MNSFNDLIEEDGNLINSLCVPEYFYRVNEFVTTFGADPGRNDAFHAVRDFKGKNLVECKSEATAYYLERLNGFESGNAKFFLPFASLRDFKHGKNAALSITLSFIEYFSENGQDYFIIEGESDREILSEGREFERSILIQKGYIKE